MSAPEDGVRTKGDPGRPPRPCIFCDGVGSSPEHIWPKWMSKHFKRTAHDKSLDDWDLVSGARVAPQRRIVHGHAVTTAIKAVCNGCNHGWMSGIETAAKPYLEPMLQGRRTKLAPDAQRALTEWAVLKMMVWELHYHPDTVVFTRDQTLEFGRSRQIPENVWIWLVRHNDRSQARIERVFASLFPLFKATDLIPERANTHTNLMFVGKLAIFLFHSQRPELQLGKFRKVHAQPLWPLRGSAFTWPPLHTLDGAALNHMSATIARFIERRGVVSIT